MVKNMEIRIMTIKDFNEMYALWNEAGLQLADYEIEKKQTEFMIKLNPASNFVAIEQGKIIGTVFGLFNGYRGWIYHLAIIPFFQKKGIGSLLLNKTERALKEIGAKRVMLGVDKSNIRILPFYSKSNYQEITSAIYLRKDL